MRTQREMYSGASSNMRHSLNTSYQQGSAVLIQPCIVGYMSVGASRNYCSDLSQLKFVTRIPKGRVSWDLNHNIDQAVKRTTDDSDEKIDLLLKFLLDQKDRFNLPPDTFITYRYTLMDVMCSAFNIQEPLCICACLYKNNIYLDEIKSALEVERRKSRSKEELAYCAWGYKFEQYMTSDHPDLAPNIDQPVVENSEFSLYFCSQLGEHKLFYGAQVDGLLATDPTPPPPNTRDVHEILNYLRQQQYVELKTHKIMCSPWQEKSFRKYKLLRCWCQCYLAKYKGLLVGFRNDRGIVEQIQWFDTAGIADYCANEWDPRTALNFLEHFLTFVRKSFSKYNYKQSFDSPITLEFTIDVNRRISVVECEHATLLPDWYIKGTKQ